MKVIIIFDKYFINTTIIKNNYISSDNLKKEVKNFDIDGFKTSINSTNTTQNKQLQTIFENMDAIKKEANQNNLSGKMDSHE